MVASLCDVYVDEMLLFFFFVSPLRFACPGRPTPQQQQQHWNVNLFFLFI